MNDLPQLLAIAGVLFLGVLSPGPNFAIVTSTAMTVSRRAGILTGLGLAAASCTWALLAVAGIGLVLARFPVIALAVRVAGAAYLVWIGIRMILGAARPMPNAGRAVTSVAAAMRKAYLVSMTNPKAIAFYGSIVSVMVPAAAPAWFDLAIVAIAALVSAAWYCSLALLFSHDAARRVFARGKTAIEAVMGTVLVGLGGRLFFSR